MSKILYTILLPILFVISIWTIVLTAIPKHGVVVYDCRIAEISPDFPSDVREACRKKNSGRI